MSLKLIVNERRRGISPIPPFPSFYLNKFLTTGVKALTKLGWRVVCIRRRSDDPVDVIFVNLENRSFGLLSGDGGFKMGSEIKIRDSQMLL